MIQERHATMPKYVWRAFESVITTAPIHRMIAFATMSEADAVNLLCLAEPQVKEADIRSWLTIIMAELSIRFGMTDEDAEVCVARQRIFNQSVDL